MGFDAQRLEELTLSVDRLLKYLSVAGAVYQRGEKTYVANAITRSLCTPGSDAGLRHLCDNSWLQLQRMVSTTHTYQSRCRLPCVPGATRTPVKDPL